MSQRVQTLWRGLLKMSGWANMFLGVSKATPGSATLKGLSSKIKNLTFHDLRHTWTSRAAEVGVPEHVRGDIVGHSSKSMTDDYTHASPEEMEQAMELVASYRPKMILNLGKISAKQKTTAETPSAVAS